MEESIGLKRDKKLYHATNIYYHFIVVILNTSVFAGRILTSMEGYIYAIAENVNHFVTTYKRNKKWLPGKNLEEKVRTCLQENYQWFNGGWERGSIFLHKKITCMQEKIQFAGMLRSAKLHGPSMFALR